MPPTTSTQPAVLRQSVLGSRRFSNYFWAVIVSSGATGFLLAGLSSYFKLNLLLFTDTTQLIFVPQGLAMTFYGVAGLLLALYLWLALLWDLGGGYNEFDRDTGNVRIFRWGFPGKNRQISLEFPTTDILAILVEIKEGLNPKRAISLRVKGRRNIPLTRIGVPLSVSSLETEAATLARFLNVPIEGL